jgi:glutaredoxin
MGYACFVVEGDSMSVVIYTKPGCPYCAAAMNDLAGRGVEFEEIDVTTTPGGQDRLAELTFGSMLVPVIVDEDGSVHVSAGGG